MAIRQTPPTSQTVTPGVKGRTRHQAVGTDGVNCLPNPLVGLFLMLSHVVISGQQRANHAAGFPQLLL